MAEHKEHLHSTSLEHTESEDESEKQTQDTGSGQGSLDRSMCPEQEESMQQVGFQMELPQTTVRELHRAACITAQPCNNA